VDDVTDDGSLWSSNGQTNYYFTKNKILGVGDIIHVVVNQAMINDMAQEIKKSLTKQEFEVELAEEQERIRIKAIADYREQKKAEKAKKRRQPASKSMRVPSPFLVGRRSHKRPTTTVTPMI